MSLLKRAFGNKGKAKAIAKIPGLSVEGSCFIPGKELVAVSSPGGEVRIVDITHDSVVKTLEGKVAEPGWIAVSHNGARLAVLDHKRGGGGDRKKIEVWDIDAGSKLFATELQNTSDSAALSPDGSILAVGRTYDPIVDLYEVATGKPTLVLDGHGPAVVPNPLFRGRGRLNDLAFSPDGRFLVSGADDGRGILWDLEAPKGYNRMKHDFFVWRICISHSGKTFATGGAESWKEKGLKTLVSLCEVTTEKANTDVFSIGAEGPAKALAFTLDDRRILVAGYDDTLWLWSGDPEAKAMGQDFGKVLALSQDATRIIAERDNGVVVWDISGLVG